MPISSEQLLFDINSFITGVFDESMLVSCISQEEKHPEKDYSQVIQHLKQCQDMASSKEEAERILFALALFKLLSPSVNERLGAIQNLKTAIQQGNSFAIYVIGYYYQQDIRFVKDPTKAVELYQKAKAVDGGNTTASGILGYYYNYSHHYDHLGRVVDAAGCVKYYQQAVKGGDTRAAFNLGSCYQYGRGVTVDLAKAVVLYQQAVDGGNDTVAADCLGYCYLEGMGVAKDPVKAVKFFQQAVDSGDARAASNLGYCYQHGLGVAKDPVKAISLYISAISAVKTSSEASDSALKNLLSCLNSTPALAPVDFAAVAKCCAIACKQFPQSEGCKTAKEILAILAEKTNNFEVHYWARLIPTWKIFLPTWIGRFSNLPQLQVTIVGLIQKDSDAFMDCLLKDDIHTLEEKQVNFNIALANCKEKISGKKVLLFLHQRGELENLRTLKPLTFFSLLPPELLPLFANAKEIATNPPVEATKSNQVPSAPSIVCSPF